MISPEYVKNIFVALRLHFTSDYNYFKYHGKIKKNTLKTSERYAAERISVRLKSEDNIRNFFIANMSESFCKDDRITAYLQGYANKECYIVYENWCSYLTAYSYKTQQELKKINFDKSFLEIEEDHPKIYLEFAKDNISFHTFVSVAAIPNMINYWKKRTTDIFVFTDFLFFVEKYKPFVEDKINYEIIKNFLTKSENFDK